jgi:hypothetical protein
MKLKQLFERSLTKVSYRDVERFKRNTEERPDLDPKNIDIDKFDRIKEKIMGFIRNGKIKIYRGVNSFDPITKELLKKRTLGQSWTYDMGSARSYRGSNYGDDYILQAEIDERYIDWEETIALNTIDTRGNFEREVRMVKGTPIKIQRVYLVNGKLLDQVDDSEIKDKTFKIR